MKHMTLTTLSQAILVIALCLTIVYAGIPASAYAGESMTDCNADPASTSESASAPGISPYALAGNSVTYIIQLSDGTVEGIAALTIRQGASWSTTLTLQKQLSEKLWSNVTSTTSNGTELSLSKHVSAGTYRIKVAVRVYDSDGKLMDSITKYSKVVQQE